MMARPRIHLSIMIFVVLLFFVTSTSSRAIEKQTNELDTIRAHLEKINKPAVKSINSPDGDIIDCVLFHDQPAFDLPELKDQKRTLKLPKWPKGYNRSKDTSSEVDSIQQLWSSSGEGCPEGTIPIVRTTEKDLLRVSNMTRFGQKAVDVSNHEHAVAVISGGPYYGARSHINIWAPNTNEGEFSLAQIWLLSGTFEAKDLNSIEVGWQVYPTENGGDKNPRLFIYWTRDAYESTGCYNLVCAGFVQVDNKIAIGAAINPISSYNGEQFEIDLMVWKDPKNGDWWLSLGGEILIGYWPSSLFTGLQSHVDMMQFGGEIVNFQVNGHTTTQMGSGHFPEEGHNKAAFFRKLNFATSLNELSPIPLSDLQTIIFQPNCYDLKLFSDDDFGTHFYYGGPGNNPKCP